MVWPVTELRAIRTLRQLKRETGFDPSASHEVVVPPGPSGRPGERVWAPSRSGHPPRLTPDLAREDFRVFIRRDGSYLGAVCLGPTSERGDVDESAEQTMNSFVGRTGDPRLVQPLPDGAVAGARARRYRIEFARTTLDEWKFEHAGWLYVAGILRRGRYRDDGLIDAGQRVLDTWTWLSPVSGPRQA